uniref:Uncharacterized protein n=1 Tax=Rhizophora mucronata TaxID=61149 RepID=A0A2P2PAF1_RHIMU
MEPATNEQVRVHLYDIREYRTPCGEFGISLSKLLYMNFHFILQNFWWPQ